VERARRESGKNGVYSRHSESEEIRLSEQREREREEKEEERRRREPAYEGNSYGRPRSVVCYERDTRDTVADSRFLFHAREREREREREMRRTGDTVRSSDSMSRIVAGSVRDESVDYCETSLSGEPDHWSRERDWIGARISQ